MKFKNPFKRNKQLKQLQALSASFAILDEFARRGVIHWHGSLPNNGRAGDGSALLIEESLATLKLAEGAEGFKKFLEQVAQWQNYKLLQDAYEAHRIDTEVKAVREAKKKYAVFTKTDIQRIRQNARENMSEIDPDKLNYVKEFDLFIIRATDPSAAEALKDTPSYKEGDGGSSGQLLALGHYDGKKLEMAMYDDIKHNIFSNS